MGEEDKTEPAQAGEQTKAKRKNRVNNSEYTRELEDQLFRSTDPLEVTKSVTYLEKIITTEAKARNPQGS